MLFGIWSYSYFYFLYLSHMCIKKKRDSTHEISEHFKKLNPFKKFKSNTLNHKPNAIGSTKNPNKKKKR